ncbi:MAG TPA: thioesterase family protein [Alphaproteobacteria bacterium]|nr:thioesterase family protein [Alphaproteobacteria bacterium]
MHDLAAIPTPFDRYRAEIRPEWIDYNGHMNVAYYVLVFDYATDAFWNYLGIGEDYLKRTNNSTFALESHITYQGEVRLGDEVRVTSQLLGVDAKRLHFLHRMYHAEKGHLAATLECVSLHVSLGTRRAAPFPPDLQAFLERVVAAHRSLGMPEEAGRRVSLSRQPAAR